jgi:uncharacterized protein (TIGR02145 family)
MKKSILCVMGFAVTAALLFIGCEDSTSPNNQELVDGFLVRVNEKPTSGGGPGIEMRTVEVESAGTGKSGGGSRTVGTSVDIDAGTLADRPFLNWTTSSPGVKFEDSASARTSFIMPPNDVKVTANFDPTFPVTVSGGTANNGRYLPNATVNITAVMVDGRPFEKWTTADSGIVFADSTSPSTSFTMPAKSVTVAAIFTGSYPVTVSSIGTGATGGGYHYVGDTVNIYAGTGTGRPFEKWTTASKGVIFADSGKESTSFIMPANEVTVTAVFKASYMVTVSSIGIGATGSSSWIVGMAVPINAGMPPAANQVFKKWTTASPGVNFKNADSAITTFIMPANNVDIKAEFEMIPGGDGSKYKSVMISGKTWMAENLYVTTEESWCYGDGGVLWFKDEGGQWVHHVDPVEGDEYDVWVSGQYRALTPAEIQVNCNTYGRLYTWAAAKSACQLIGWRLPSKDDWDSLFIAAGGTDIAGKALKSTSGWNNVCGYDSNACRSGNGTDDFEFSALSNGYRLPDYYHPNLWPVGGYDGYWTAKENSKETAWLARMYSDSDVADTRTTINKEYGFYVRCVKDD